MSGVESVVREQGSVKCVVWDLDNTLWKGVLLEDGKVELRPEAVAAVRELDALGVLQSIASRNDPDDALARLREAGLEQYFLHPQIGWQPKSESIASISASLNLAIDSFCLIDDEPFERAEVAAVHPAVLCLDPTQIPTLARRIELTPRFVTDDARQRRRMYMDEIERKQQESDYDGRRDEFMESLGMVLTISRATREDLQRAEELTVRTHQLNTTGYTYAYSELDALRRSDRHLLLVADLRDRFGGYGKIGLALIETSREVWHLRLLLMSCRVMARGIGQVLLCEILSAARRAGVRLRGEYRPNGRNRMMLLTYRFSGFSQVEKNDAGILLEHDGATIPENRHVRVIGDAFGQES